MKRRLLFIATGGMLATLLLAAPALAQDATTADAVQVTLDNIWILIAAVLVIFMNQLASHRIHRALRTGRGADRRAGPWRARAP